jgi:2-phospho-L-lactate transferase/gluconeogenesis factor (CofD/UPF0052 family)/tRNA A-37 threonylcarbamoyl transferase component Bud32
VPILHASDKDGRLGQLRVRHVLGRGAQAAVCLAYHERLGIPVAVKVLKPSFLAELEADDPQDHRERALREIRLMARIQHRNVLRVYDALLETLSDEVGNEHTLVCLVLDYAPGETIGDLLDRETQVSVSRALSIASQVAEALHALGREGIIHGDVKPENVLLTQDPHSNQDWVRLSDFGIAADLGVPETSSYVWGTPVYLAPEVFRPGGEKSSLSDVYALGVTIYEMLSGGQRAQLPFHTQRDLFGATLVPSFAAFVEAHGSLPLARPDIPDGLGELLTRMVAPHPEERCSLDEVRAGLREHLRLVGALEERLSFAFLPPGWVVGREHLMPGNVYVDIGNDLRPGIVDAHVKTTGRSATQLLANRPDLLLDHVSLGEWVTVWTHFHPDLDACAATALVQYLLGEGQGVVSLAWKELAKCVDALDSGHNPFHIPPERSFYAVFQAVDRLVRERDTQPLDPHLTSAAILRRGHDLVTYLLRCLEQGRDLLRDDLFEGVDHDFLAEVAYVQSDYGSYLEDLRGGQVFRVTIPSRDSEREAPTDLLAVTDPRSLLFKMWARADTRHSPRGEGFVMTCVVYKRHRRAIISTDPTSSLCLRGLADLLEAREVEARRVFGCVRRGVPRSGYGDSVDPWFDGRGTHLDCTIVDAPGCGTVLSRPQVLKIVLHYARAEQVPRSSLSPRLPRRSGTSRIATIGAGEDYCALLAGLRDCNGIEVDTVAPPLAIPESTTTAISDLLALGPCAQRLQALSPLPARVLGKQFGQGGALAGWDVTMVLLRATRDSLESLPNALEALCKLLELRGRVLLAPSSETAASAPALEVFRRADLVLIGPGDPLPTLRAPGMAEALADARGRLVYCPGVQADGLPADDLRDLVLELERQIGGRVVDGIIHNTRLPLRGDLEEEEVRLLGVKQVHGWLGPRTLHEADLLEEGSEVSRHDPAKLADLIVRFL